MHKTRLNERSVLKLSAIFEDVPGQPRVGVTTTTASAFPLSRAIGAQLKQPAHELAENGMRYVASSAGSEKS